MPLGEFQCDVKSARCVGFEPTTNAFVIAHGTLTKLLGALHDAPDALTSRLDVLLHDAMVLHRRERLTSIELRDELLKLFRLHGADACLAQRGIAQRADFYGPSPLATRREHAARVYHRNFSDAPPRVDIRRWPPLSQLFVPLEPLYRPAKSVLHRLSSLSHSPRLVLVAVVTTLLTTTRATSATRFTVPQRQQAALTCPTHAFSLTFKTLRECAKKRVLTFLFRLTVVAQNCRCCANMCTTSTPLTQAWRLPRRLPTHVTPRKSTNLTDISEQKNLPAQTRDVVTSCALRVQRRSRLHSQGKRIQYLYCFSVCAYLVLLRLSFVLVTA